MPNAFARSAPGIHLSLRWGTRALQVLSPRIRTSSTPWRAAMVASVAGDLVGAVMMKRQGGRRSYGRWLAADAAEVALWSAAGDGSTDGWNQEQILAFPLAMDAGARFGAKALAVPVVCWASGAAVHHLRHQPLRVGPMFWQVFAVAVGTAAAARSRSISARVRALRDQDLAARRHAAELAGQNAEAMGVDSAVDRLQRAMALLHLGTQGSGEAAGEVATWKAGLASTSRASAAYLGDVLYAWQRVRNAHPDLSWAVRVHVRQEQGSTLLTRAQGADLRAQLEARTLAGDVLVELVSGTEVRPGRGIDLRINGDILSLASDLDRGTIVPDPLPTALFTSAAFQLLPLLGQYGAAPWQRVLWPAAGTLALALVNERELCTGGALDARRLLVSASPLAVWSTVVATTSSHEAQRAPGEANAAFFGPLAAHHVLLGFCLHRLTRREQVAALVAGAGWFAGLCWLLPRHLNLRSTLAEAVVPVAATSFAHNLAQGYAEEARRAITVAQGEESAVLERSYRDGQERVRSMVARSVAEAWAIFEAQSSLLEEDLREEVRRRLEGCSTARLARETVAATSGGPGPVATPDSIGGRKET